MTKPTNEIEIAVGASGREDEKCPLFVNGQLVLAKLDETGQIVGPIEPFNPANLNGRAMMFAK